MAKRKVMRPPAATLELETPEPESEIHYAAGEVLEFTRRTRAAAPTGTADAPASDPNAADDIVYDVVISSETPVITPWGHEVLGHGPGEIDLRTAKAGISWLLEHGGPNAPYRIDPAYHAGIVEGVTHDEKARKLRGTVRFGNAELAQVAEADFAEGSRPFVSVGWCRGPNTVTKTTKREGQPDLTRITGWVPVEASLVSVPADFRARKGRSGPGIEGIPAVTEGDAPIREERRMKKVRNPETGVIVEVAEDDPRPVAIEPGAGGGQRSATEVQSEANTRASQIVRICRQFGQDARAAEFIESSKSVPEILDSILETRTTKGGGVPASDAPIVPGLTHKETKRYSIVRAMRCAATGKFDGFEGELHNDIEKRLPSNFERRGGVFVPLRLQDETEEHMFVRETRALGSGVPDQGATLVVDRQMELIDILRNAAMCARLGARTLSGLVGTISFPKKTADVTVQRMQENPAAAAGASNAKYGWVLGSPKTYIGVTPLPRQLLNLTSFDVEADSRANLVAQHGLTLDFDALYGSGAANAPLGIYPDPAVQTLAMGGPETFPKLIKMVGLTAAKNALLGALGFLTTPLNAAQLATTLQAAAVASPFIWQGRLEAGQIAAYPAMSTNQVSAVMTGRAAIGGAEHGTIFGPWDNLLFLLWGALELQADNVTLADKGQVRIISFLMGDVVNQRPEAFVVSTGATVV